MPITIRRVETGTDYSGANSSVTVTVPAEVGDLLVLFYGTDYTSSGLNDHTTPTGGGTWTRRTPVIARTYQMPNISVWTRPVTASGNQVTVVSNGNDAGVYAQVYVISGHDMDDPVVDADSVIVTSASASWVAPAVDGADGGLLLCGWQSQYPNTTAPTIPGSMSDAVSTVNNDAEGVLCSAREVLDADGDTGTRTATGQNDQYAAASIVIRATTGPKTIYVAPTGNDANSGLVPQSPKATIAGGMSAASAGDTVLVADGVYEGNVITPKGGSAGNFITVKAENKWGATIKGDDSTAKQAAVEINHSYVRFQDFEITGDVDSGLRNGVVVNASNVQVVGCHIHTICQFLTEGTGWQGGAGIDFWYEDTLENVLIDGNLIHNIGLWETSDQQLVHGMYPAQPAINCVISNNVVYECEDYGIQLYPQDEATGWVVVNNTVAYTGRGIRTGNNTTVRNNISFNNKTADFDVRGSGSVLSNNISYGPGSASRTGVTVVDPEVVDATGRDFNLTALSPAIDAGTATDAPVTDIRGVARPQGLGIDVGAYEYRVVTGTGAAGPGPDPAEYPSENNYPGEDIYPAEGLPRPLSGLTATATGGTYSVVGGTAEADLGGLDAAATGTSFSVVSGTAEADLGGVTASATGVRTTTGTATADLGQLTAAASGTRTTAGSGSTDLGALDAAAVGTRVVEGAAQATLGGVDASATGVRVVVGTGATPLLILTATAEGEVVSAVVTGTAVAHLGGLQAEAIGIGYVPITEGTAVAYLGELWSEATGGRTTEGTAAADLGIRIARGVGERTTYGAAQAPIGFTASATGVRDTEGTAAADLGSLVATAAGGRLFTGTGAAHLGGLVATAEGRALLLVVGTAVAQLGRLVALAASERTSLPRAGVPVVGVGVRAGAPVVATSPRADQPQT